MLHTLGRSLILRAKSDDAIIQDRLEWTADFSYEMARKVTEVREDDLGEWFSPGPASFIEGP